ncbi:MAG TPA: hypothetical protein VMT62_13955 [Syntrophorhabdaceae bacterium]|nr:hypothetical protein [Syntrophorhabdaceae bacterium]
MAGKPRVKDADVAAVDEIYRMAEEKTEVKYKNLLHEAKLTLAFATFSASYGAKIKGQRMQENFSRLLKTMFLREAKEKLKFSHIDLLLLFHNMPCMMIESPKKRPLCNRFFDIPSERGRHVKDRMCRGTNRNRSFGVLRVRFGPRIVLANSIDTKIRQIVQSSNKNDHEWSALRI